MGEKYLAALKELIKYGIPESWLRRIDIDEKIANLPYRLIIEKDRMYLQEIVQINPFMVVDHKKDLYQENIEINKNRLIKKFKKFIWDCMKEGMPIPTPQMPVKFNEKGEPSFPWD